MIDKYNIITAKKFKFAFAKLNVLVRDYMNPFFDICPEYKSPQNKFQLAHLGSKRIFLTTVPRRGSDYWRTTGQQSKDYYRQTTSEDYDQQFIEKLRKWKPIYEIDSILQHHYQHYFTSHPHNDAFLKHMRYVIFPKIKPSSGTTPLSELFKQWIDRLLPTLQAQQKENTVNHNTINVGNINAPTQFQQNSNDSVQTQYNQLEKQALEAFELLKKDILNMDEQIRNDFLMEMDYATAQLSKDKDIKSQLLNIGSLMTQVGVGMFSSLLAAPVYDLIKPYLGFH